MNEQSIFTAALEAEDSEQRAALLDRECHDDAALRERIERLLLRHAQDDSSFLEHAAPSLLPTVDVPHCERPGTVIGPYKLLQQIGEGGMGAVFMAEQTQPVQRKVALKVIRAGMDSRSVIARFEAERQALALMDHVNIARVLDAGTTTSGRPYFVMELVHGVPITTYCDDNRLTPRQRLELFIPVCQAIQHAHQKGIIHRDIKPSNVMVTLCDGNPVPKVIDFGVAKATQQRLTERTLFTEYGAMVGTPEYMSPEQAEMSALGVDTRSDIYSLGVLLYELLTGSTPLSHKRLREAAYGEVLRLIKEEEPPKPSTRLSDSGEALASISANRHMEPAKLTRLMRGDLDWMVMKTLEKDRNRRYETASGFAADVQRYLDDEPVLACPPSVGYRLRKFARRNRTSVIASSIILALTMAGTTFGAALVLREKSRTEVALDESLENEARAEAAAAETQAVLHYVVQEILASADPARRRGRDLTVLDALANAERNIDTAFPDQPLVEAYVRHVIGHAYKGLGMYRDAERHTRRAAEIRAQLLGAEHVNTLSTSMNLAVVLFHQGRLAEARQINLELIAIKRRTLGDEHPDTLDSLINLGNVYNKLGRYEEARDLHEQVLKVRLRSLGEEHPDTLTAMSNLANALFDLGQPRQALDYYEQVVALRTTVLGEDHPDTLVAMGNKANGLSFFGKDREALALYRQTIELQKRILGPDHIQTIETLANMVRMLEDKKSLEEGRLMLEGALAACLRQVGEEHPDTILVRYNLGQLHGKLGDLSKARGVLAEAIGAQSGALGETHPHTLEMRAGLAGLLMAHGKYEEAREIYAHLLEQFIDIFGPEHPQTLDGMHNKAVAIYRGGGWIEAQKLFAVTLERKRAALGDEHPDTLNGMYSLAAVLLTLNRVDEAEALMDEAMPIMRRVLGDEHPDTITATNNLIQLRTRRGQHEEARRLAEETLALRQRLFGPEHKQTIDAMDNLANLRGDQGELEEARRMKEEILELRTRVFGREHPDTLRTMHNLMNTLLNLDDLAEARRIGEEVVALRKRVLPPDHPNTLDTMHDLACIMTRQGDWEAALPIFEFILPKEAGLRGADHQHTLLTAFNLANTLHHLAALVREEKGGFQERDELFQRALAHIEPLAERYPTNRRYTIKLAQIRSDLARFLATWPEAELRRPQDAVRLAQQAVETLSDSWLCLNTLALAHYRAGDWKAALATLEKSVTQQESPVPQDSFLLAMALWKLDRKEEAKLKLADAVRWMQDNEVVSRQNPATWRLLERLKSEATALLEQE